MKAFELQKQFEQETGWVNYLNGTCVNTNTGKVYTSYVFKSRYSEWLENKMINCRKDVLYENVDKLRNMKLDVDDKYKGIANSILSTAANKLLDSE